MLDYLVSRSPVESDKSASVVIVTSVVRGGGGPQHVYRVMCEGLGEEYLTLAVGNGATPTNKFPANELTTARYIPYCYYCRRVRILAISCLSLNFVPANKTFCPRF